MHRFPSVIVVVVLLAAFVSAAMGNIGYARDVLPVDGAGFTPDDDIDVEVRVYKAGCTGNPGPCTDIEGLIYYRCDTDVDFIELPMAFSVRVGNADKHAGTIPSGHGCSMVEFYVKVVDTTDGEELYPADQNGNPPDFFLPITIATTQDVLVMFQLCIPEASAGDVCITGSNSVLMDWTQPGVLMTRPCAPISPNLYDVTLIFPAGSNPNVEYRYQKDACVTEDENPNRSFVIDDTGPTQVLDIDVWAYGFLDCLSCVTPVEETTWGTVRALYR